MNNYFYIPYKKEILDSLDVIESINWSKWVKKDTIIVNCFPEYSSRLTQLVNHKLSYLNRNELYEVIDLAIPYPDTFQVWDNVEKSYRPFDNYLYDWSRLNIRKDVNYLFITSGIFRDKDMLKVKQAVKQRLEPDNYRFLSLYLQSDSTFTPDFFFETFNKDIQGPLLFEWENVNNPNRK